VPRHKEISTKWRFDWTWAPQQWMITVPPGLAFFSRKDHHSQYGCCAEEKDVWGDVTMVAMASICWLIQAEFIV